MKYDKRKAYHQRKPLVKYICWAKRRCASNDPRWKPRYLDLGVQCRLTVDDAEFMWFRDGAAQMKRPSIDRISTGPGMHYSLDNCRFMEWLENVRRPHLEPNETL